MNNWEKFKLLVRVSRPSIWVLGPLLFLSALFYSGGSLSLVSVIQLVLLSFPLSILLYGINDIYDYNSDRVNNRKKGMDGIVLDKKHHLFVKKVSIFVSILLLVGALVSFNLVNIISMFLLLFVAYYYSMLPLRFKEHPPFGVISVGLASLLIIFLGYSFGGNIFEASYKIYLIPLLIMAFQIFHTVVDYIPDKKAGYKTFASVFGKRFSSLVSFFIFLIIFVFGGVRTLAIRLFILAGCLVLLTMSIYPSEKFSPIIQRLFVLLGIIMSIIFLLTYNF
ncbi:UbiA family prenyltransferase [archaeon]|nr:UbiA family prenyltransferase [archaeon]